MSAISVVVALLIVLFLYCIGLSVRAIAKRLVPAGDPHAKPLSKWEKVLLNDALCGFGAHARWQPY